MNSPSSTSRRPWRPRLAVAWTLLVAGLLGPGPLFAGMTSSASASTFPPGAAGPAACPWYLGPIRTNGALGSEGVIATFLPAFTTESCTTATPVTLTFATPNGVLSANIAGNPITATATLTFSRGGGASTFTFFWSPHCGDPQPVRLTVSAGGQTSYADNGDSSCSGFGVGVTSRVTIVGPGVGPVGISTGLAVLPDQSGAWVSEDFVPVTAHGSAPFLDQGPITSRAPVRGIAADPVGVGYWLVASDGGIFSFGDATFYGSTGSMVLNQPVVGMASTPDGHGYWLVASDGGIFGFGDAAFYGSGGGQHLPARASAIAATKTGHGYWLLLSDGSILPFGDAHAFSP